MNTTLITTSSSSLSKEVSEELTKFITIASSKIQFFNRSNSQTTLLLNSLTMLNGISPLRILKQIMAETNQRTGALYAAKVSLAKKNKKLTKLLSKTQDEVTAAKLDQLRYTIDTLSNTMEASIKDIAALSNAYSLITKKYNLEKWTEEDYEKGEKLHHLRRGFELAYVDLVTTTIIGRSACEYLQQYGLNIFTVIQEISEFIARYKQADDSKSIALEEFLDEMANKYIDNPDIISEKIFGVREIYKKEYTKIGQDNDS